MNKIFKINILVMVVVLLGVAGWLYLERTGNSGQAGRAANAIIAAADRAIDSARADERYGENEEENFVDLGAIFTSNGNVVATLIVRGTKGAGAVCNNIAFVRNYLVGLMSDHPPDSRNLAACPVGYNGYIRDGINKLVQYDAVQRIRYDPYRLG